MSLYWIMGLPRSGKSTFARDWQDYKITITDNNLIDKGLCAVLLHPYTPRVVVNADSIRLALTGDRFNSLTETYIDAIKHTVIRSFLLQGYDVLVDGTHTTEQNIIKLLNIDKDAKFYYINTSKAICQQRAIKSNQRDLIPIINNMDENVNKLCQYNISSLIERIDELRKLIHINNKKV